MSDVEHDESNDVVVEGEGRLLGQLWDEPDQGSEAEVIKLFWIVKSTFGSVSSI
jgi:hypothetical protein